MRCERFVNVKVDSGMIIVAYASIMNMLGYYYQKRQVPNGTYNVKLTVSDTWNGTVITTGKLKITSGQMIITDPCYIIKPWDKFLKAVYSKHGKKDFKKCPMHFQNIKYENEQGFVIADNMGGDGAYKAKIELKRE
jgi:hypothetical protein